MGRLRTIHAALGAVVVGLGSLGLTQAGAPVRPLSLPTPDVLEPSMLPLAVTPTVDPAPEPGTVLERRLAALAAAVENRQGAPVGLVAFDVEGLGLHVQEVLGGIGDRARVSVHVRDLETQHVLFDYFGHAPLNPASNQKLLTTSAALDLLGPDYVFTTEVARTGRDLVIVGTGDPMLSADDLRALAHVVAERVDLAPFERLVVDDSAFSTRRLGPGYPTQGPGYAYEAPSGALSVEFNSLQVTVRRVSGEAQPVVEVEPPGAHVRIDNQVTFGRRRAGPYVRTYEDGDHTVVEVTGRLTKRSRATTVRRRVTDPGLFAGSAFAQMLADATASEPLPVVRGHRGANADTVIVNDSAPLIEIVNSGLAYSNNFIAEQVLRTVAWRMTGDPGDWATGQEILYDYWATLSGDTDVVVENASGLSREGRLTTSGLVDLISVAHRVRNESEGIEANLIDALPVAGEPGTLRSRLRKSGKRVRAKTGTLNGVSGLSGIITSEAGDPQVGFSILINAEEGAGLVAKRRRRVEDKIVLAVLDAVDQYEAHRSGIAK